MADQTGSERSGALTLEREPKAPERSPVGADDETAPVQQREAVAASEPPPRPAEERPRVSSAHAWAMRLRQLTERLARTIAALTLVVTVTIALGIVFKVLGANTGKWLVSTVEDLAKALASPFDQMFTPHNAKLAVAVNWGIAIVVYAMAGSALARLVRRAAAGPRLPVR